EIASRDAAPGQLPHDFGAIPSCMFGVSETRLRRVPWKVDATHGRSSPHSGCESRHMPGLSGPGTRKAVETAGHGSLPHHGRVHVSRYLTHRERAVVDAHLVDETVEELAGRRGVAADAERAVALDDRVQRRRHDRIRRSNQHAVDVELL